MRCEGGGGGNGGGGKGGGGRGGGGRGGGSSAEAKLHPSWEASNKADNKGSIQQFQGKRVTFD